PTLNRETLKAVIVAAHARKKLAIVHIGSLQDSRDAIAAGADGLAHLFVDQPPDGGFGEFVAVYKAFVVPTLTVLESVCGPGGGHLCPRGPLRIGRSREHRPGQARGPAAG